MPHQCLQCGKVFPSGSPEILKGCGNCGGKRFFYTNDPISDDQREALQEQANQDVKGLIRDMLTQREPFTKFDSEEPDTLGRPKGEEWIRVKPRKPPEPVPKKPEPPPMAKPVEKDTKPGVAQLVETEVKKGVKDKVKTKLKPIRITKRKKLKPKKDVKKVKKARKPIKAPEPVAKPVTVEIEPDIINIVEPGVYEIDIKRMLEENPIIIQKDGAYYVHLPSIFEKMQEK
jgi:predicted  nucleic acid-binding Zn-ribbon protein